MTLPTLRLFAFLATLSMATMFAADVEPAIIAKARARLAPDAVLDAVNTIHYSGVLTGPDAADSTKEIRQTIEIFLQKPAQQRIVVTSPTFVEVSALDEFEAWRRTTDRSDPTKWEQQQLSVDQIKQLRADVWQNLYFFRGIERIGGRVEDQGPITISGVACEKIAFFHSPTLVYYRYFDQATGALVFTGDERNNVREEGEMLAGGIRFPKTILISQTVNDKTTTRRITFEKIAVNEQFPAGIFAVPLPTLK